VNEPTPTRWRRAVGPLLPGLVGTGLLAVLCNLALELTQLTGVRSHPWQYKTPAYVAMFLLGCVVLWMVVGIVHAVVGRLTVTAALVVAATAAVAVADYEKLQLRREPLFPNDLRFAGDVGFLTAMIGARVLVLLVLGTLALALVAFAGARSLRRRLAPRTGPHSARARRGRVLLRVLTGTLCLLGVAYLSNFNSPGNAARGAYGVLGAAWRPWSQERNYIGNGFVGGFLYNLDVPAMARPAGYSAAEMARIASTYTRAAEQINRTRDPHGLDDVNVVMVLSESFSDPEALEGVHLDKDPIPFTRRLMGSSLSGAMLAQHVGGGTANMEFEALTGMSLSQFPPQMAVPYQMLVPTRRTFPSVVQWLEQDGHRTVAVHPFTTEMYRRRDAYRSFGFDDFVYDRRMHEQRRLGHEGYISDASAFDEVQRTIDSENEPVFVNLVTMQNHMPYQGRYDDPVHVTGPDGASLADIGQYVRGLTHSDDALRRLIGRLRASDEKTVVVFYGDHLPGAYPDSVFEANGPRVMRQTPFFVWSNFPGTTGRRPTTSPIHFMDLVLERADAAVSPYYALLDELRHEVPAMEGGMIVGSSDHSIRRSQLSESAARLLHDYRLVQYDLSVGRRYAEGAMFAPAPAR
jgi:phosphoglycerol transferase MdoB-like AlkP superfamily enzyme